MTNVWRILLDPLKNLYTHCLKNCVPFLVRAKEYSGDFCSQQMIIEAWVARSELGYWLMLEDTSALHWERLDSWVSCLSSNFEILVHFPVLGADSRSQQTRNCSTQEISKAFQTGKHFWSYHKMDANWWCIWLYIKGGWIAAHIECKSWMFGPWTSCLYTAVLYCMSRWIRQFIS